MKNIVYVENGSFIGVTENGLKFTRLRSKETECFAFDDVEVLIFDDENSFLTVRVIEACLKNRIRIIFCSANHSPLETVETVYSQRSRLEHFRSQLALTSKVRKRVWRKIVIEKISNQARCLELNCSGPEVINLIRSVINNVVNGDEHNSEAYAARIYFRALFGNNFKRGRTMDFVNASLNYTYAVVRMVIRQLLVAKGLEPSLGIHHASTENPFNLSDDLIEPYRPLIDYFLIKKIFPQRQSDEELSSEIRRQLVQVLFERCVINNRVMYLGDALHLTVDTVATSIKQNSSANVKLPSFIKGGD